MTETEKKALEAAEAWASEPFDEETRAEVGALIAAGDLGAIADRFGDSLHFGTAGLRGVMGAGRTRMNRYMVAKASRALAATIVEEYGAEAASRGVIVGYDCRHHSDEFARVAAAALAAGGVRVYMYDRLTPTNLVPFAVRRLGAFAGVMVTSSHNPKVYNGYKVFWSNGAQIISPVDAQVASRMDALGDTGNFGDLDEAVASGAVTVLDGGMVDAYIDWAVGTAVHTGAHDVKVVYTPLGGTGWECARRVFEKAGFGDVHVVVEEKDPSGDFAGLDAPNPERPDTWPRALKLAEGLGADIVLANDGDADRLGCAIPKAGGGYRVLGGNQIGALMLHYLTSHLPADRIGPDSFAICSVVSSPLTRAICEGMGIDFQETLTGFKWMGNVADERARRGQNFVFAYEEAFGYTFGEARDKDGTISVLLLAEIAADCRARGITVADLLDEIYVRFGIHLEDAAERFYEGVSGSATMAAVLNGLRGDPPHAIGGTDVVAVRDLLNLRTVSMADGAVVPVIHLPRQDMLTFYLADGSWVSLRPSGTEPKLKAYMGVVSHASKDEYPVMSAAAAVRLARLKGAVVGML